VLEKGKHQHHQFIFHLREGDAIYYESIIATLLLSSQIKLSIFFNLLLLLLCYHHREASERGKYLFSSNII